jgi:hypothetical protein
MTEANNALVTPLAYSLADLARIGSQNKNQQISQPIPVSITKIHGELVQVKIEAKGRGIPYTIPEFIVPQSFSEWIREPTQVGDKGWLVESNYYLGGMSGLNGGTANYYDRSNLTNMVFQHISQKQFPHNVNRNLNQVFQNGPEGVMNQTTDGKFFVNVDGKNAQVQLGANGSTITFKQDSVVITIGGQSHTFTSSMFQSAGDVLTHANTTLDSHLHSDSGGAGDSGPPIPGT